MEKDVNVQYLQEVFYTCIIARQNDFIFNFSNVPSSFLARVFYHSISVSLSLILILIYLLCDL